MKDKIRDNLIGFKQRLLFSLMVSAVGLAISLVGSPELPQTWAAGVQSPDQQTVPTRPIEPTTPPPNPAPTSEVATATPEPQDDTNDVPDTGNEENDDDDGGSDSSQPSQPSQPSNEANGIEQPAVPLDGSPAEQTEPAVVSEDAPATGIDQPAETTVLPAQEDPATGKEETAAPLESRQQANQPDIAETGPEASDSATSAEPDSQPDPEAAVSPTRAGETASQQSANETDSVVAEPANFFDQLFSRRGWLYLLGLGFLLVIVGLFFIKNA